MKLIEKLENQIEEEIEGAEGYAKCALANKEEYPDLADTYYTLAGDELDHVKTLHNHIAKLIRDYKDAHGEPPASMKAVYDYLHQKQIDKVNSIQIMLNQYRAR